MQVKRVWAPVRSRLIGHSYGRRSSMIVGMAWESCSATFSLGNRAGVRCKVQLTCATCIYRIRPVLSQQRPSPLKCYSKTAWFLLAFLVQTRYCSWYSRNSSRAMPSQYKGWRAPSRQTIRPTMRTASDSLIQRQPRCKVHE